MGIPIVIVLVLAVIILMSIFGMIEARKRREALAAFAAQHGLHFVSDDLLLRETPFEDVGFALMDQGHDRTASSLLYGQVDGHRVHLFEYRYKTGSGKDESTYHYTCCVWGLPVPLADMAIRPEGLMDRVAEWFGDNDIDFESAEFSRRYHVNGDDRREVYAVVTPQMMEFIMGSDLEYLEIIGDTALVHKSDGTLTPELCRWFLDVARGFDRHLPEHLIRQKRGRGHGDGRL